MKKVYSVINGDIVASTTLEQEEKDGFQEQLKFLFKQLEEEYNSYSRIYKGDYFECVNEQSEKGLRIALLIKSFIKGLDVEIKNKKRGKYFKEYGARIVIGYGELSEYNRKDGKVDGEAIYLAGRKLSSEEPTYNKSKIIIKNSLFFETNNKELKERIQPIVELLDHIVSKATAKQCEVLYHKLRGREEKQIAKQLGIQQSTVNRHSTSVGWNAIETAVNYFEQELNRQ